MTDYNFPRGWQTSLAPLDLTDRYNPAAVRDCSPFRLGSFVIRRTPLRGTPYLLYSVLLDSDVIGSQITFPSESDCHVYRRKSEYRETAKSRLSPVRFNNRPADKTLPGRIVEVLRAGGEMDQKQIAQILEVGAKSIGAVLGELTRNTGVLRRGTSHRYLYRVRA